MGLSKDMWQPIETHNGLYEVSEDGQVRKTNGVHLKQWTNDQGYSLVRLSSPRVVARVHRLVAQAFIQNPEGLPFVNHLDCVRSNNAAYNLEWCTQWQNLKHSRDLGRMQACYWKGKRSPNAMLSEDEVKSIRDEYKNGGISWERLGIKHNVSKRSIGRIVNGESYA